jgi:hypothetical protein
MGSRRSRTAADDPNVWSGRASQEDSSIWRMWSFPAESNCWVSSISLARPMSSSFTKFMTQLLNHPQIKPLLSDEHFRWTER